MDSSFGDDRLLFFAVKMKAVGCLVQGRTSCWMSFVSFQLVAVLAYLALHDLVNGDLADDLNELCNSKTKRRQQSVFIFAKNVGSAASSNSSHARDGKMLL
eukprot:236222-Rhodomonas_salina.2